MEVKRGDQTEDRTTGVTDCEGRKFLIFDGLGRHPQRFRRLPTVVFEPLMFITVSHAQNSVAVHTTEGSVGRSLASLRA